MINRVYTSNVQYDAWLKINRCVDWITSSWFYLTDYNHDVDVNRHNRRNWVWISDV